MCLNPSCSVASPQGSGSPRPPAAGEVAVEEMAERLAQTEQLVSQLKEMIREKDGALRSKDEQLKVRRRSLASHRRLRLNGNKHTERIVHVSMGASPKRH